ncbi:hypothetical protein PMSD_28165 [Paenibacillus macquariensis subsp. defensor]|nr:hypothetical protein PMSD_28165 [Paenibacillus macquariensis subsp. defensor]
MLLLSFGVGVTSCSLSINIMAGLEDPEFIVWDPGPGGVLTFYLSIIIIGYSVLMFILNKKNNQRLVMIALYTFLLSLVLTPLYIIYSVDVSNYFKTPSHKTQTAIRKEIQRIIEENDLPYIIDSKESESRTKYEVIRTVILLKKETEGKIQQNEVGLVLRNRLNAELSLVFYDKNQQEYVSVVLNKDKRIVDCNPMEFCK